MTAACTIHGTVTEYNGFYAGEPILVTGGAGFIGSNLVRKLVGLGAHVTVVDALLPSCGGSLFNLSAIRESIYLSITELQDVEGITSLVRGQKIIFNLAGQVSHEKSMRDPVGDLKNNYWGHCCLLENCRKNNPEARIIFTGTRQVYGRPRYLPVDEDHPLDPIDVNGINKLAAARLHTLYHEVYGMWTSVLQLTNTYGPYQSINDAGQGFTGWLIGQALRGETISLYGDGQQQRDLTHVDDVVHALLLAGMDRNSSGQVFNLGGEMISLLDFARLLGEFLPVSIELIPFPEERRRIDIGSYVADWRKICLRLGWIPRVALREGIRSTLNFYQSASGHYDHANSCASPDDRGSRSPAKLQTSSK